MRRAPRPTGLSHPSRPSRAASSPHHPPRVRDTPPRDHTSRFCVMMRHPPRPTTPLEVEWPGRRWVPCCRDLVAAAGPASFRSARSANPEPVRLGLSGDGDAHRFRVLAGASPGTTRVGENASAATSRCAPRRTRPWPPPPASTPPTSIPARPARPRAPRPSPTARFARLDELEAQTLFVFGRQDPHVPFAGRERLRARLEAVGAPTSGTFPLYAAHGFVQATRDRATTLRAVRAVLWGGCWGCIDAGCCSSYCERSEALCTLFSL